MASLKVQDIPTTQYKIPRNTNNQQQKSAPSNILHIPQAQAKPSLENLKANFITFTGNEGEMNFEVTTNTGVKLDDVGGVEQVKDIIQHRILDYIKDPQKFQEQGAPIPKGVLLYGPPGTGKTYLAKAIAGEAGVPFISTAGSEFINKYVGVGASNVRKLFEFAIKEADWHPSKTAIIFIDEFDSVAKKRGGNNEGNEDRQTLNQLLKEMDGMSKNKNVNIIVMAATNRIEDLDSAAIRDGRFDYKIEVPNPSRSASARKAIVEVHSRKKKFKSEEDKQQIMNETAEITKGFSGAKIAELMNRSAMFAALRDDPKYITMDDIRESKLEIMAGPKIKSDTPEWSKTGTYAHEAGHALIGQFLTDTAKNPWEKPRENSFITLEERGEFLGAVFTEEGENPTISFNSLIANTAMMYGGYFVEKMNYGSNFAGVSSDLENATNYVTEAVTKYGMGPKTQMLAVQANPFAKEAAKDTAPEDIKIITSAAAKVAKLIIEENKGFIDEYVDSCKNNPKKTISGQEFANMLHEWSQKHKSQEDIANLQTKIRVIIDQAQRGELPKDN